jgi:hypothetical protein
METTAKSAFIRRKSPPTTLTVWIGSSALTGEIAADVFCRALKVMGLQRVAILALKESGVPIVSRARPDRDRNHREIDGWFINTHSNTRVKKAILEEAAEALNIPIEVRTRLRSEIWKDLIPELS